MTPSSERSSQPFKENNDFVVDKFFDNTGGKYFLEAKHEKYLRFFYDIEWSYPVKGIDYLGYINDLCEKYLVFIFSGFSF